MGRRCLLGLAICKYFTAADTAADPFNWIALEIGHAVRHSTFAAGAIMFLTIITAGISALYNAVAWTREHWQVVRT